MQNLVDENDKFVGSYGQWLRVQLSGWDTLPWALFGFALGMQGMSFFLNPITWTSVISFVATVFGSLCTVAMCAGGTDPITGKRVTSRSINGLLGAVSVVGFIIVNASMGHWFSVLDQLIFFFLIDVELMVTWRSWGRGENASIKQLTKKGYAYAGLAIVIGWAILYFIGVKLGDQQPLFDSLVLSMGATASWLCYRRISFTYKLWLASDFVQIALFVATIVQAGFTQASFAMVMNYAFYLLTAIVGLINWKPTK